MTAKHKSTQPNNCKQNDTDDQQLTRWHPPFSASSKLSTSELFVPAIWSQTATTQRLKHGTVKWYCDLLACARAGLTLHVCSAHQGSYTPRSQGPCRDAKAASCTQASLHSVVCRDSQTPRSYRVATQSASPVQRPKECLGLLIL